MSLRAPTSRCRLTWKVFNREAGGQWKLVLSRYYAGLFEVYFSYLVGKPGAAFRDSSTGKTRYAFFSDLGERDEKRIRGFLEFYGEVVCLSTNRHLETTFSDQLDFCLALDFNKPSPKEGRTEIGEWEYRAKYHRDGQAIAELGKRLAHAVRLLPGTRIPKPRLLTYVPCEADREFYLPAELVRAVVKAVPDTFWGVSDPLVTAKLSVTKRSAKNLSVDQKVAQWERITEARGINLSRPVRDCSVIVVEDLYQSGASLWSFGKYLKSRRAGMVVGLACVKSLRDTDNQ